VTGLPRWRWTSSTNKFVRAEASGDRKRHRPRRVDGLVERNYLHFIPIDIFPQRHTVTPPLAGTPPSAKAPCRRYLHQPHHSPLSTQPSTPNSRTSANSPASRKPQAIAMTLQRTGHLLEFLQKPSPFHDQRTMALTRRSRLSLSPRVVNEVGSEVH
jgi:hypothetical protein